MITTRACRSYGRHDATTVRFQFYFFDLAGDAHYIPTVFATLISPLLHLRSLFAVGTESTAFGVRMNERNVLSGTFAAFEIEDRECPPSAFSACVRYSRAVITSSSGFDMSRMMYDSRRVVND